MILLQRGSVVFIPFLGTHDECQRWLENNSRLKEVTPGRGIVASLFIKPPSFEGSENPIVSDIEENAEDEIAMKITEKDLRRVFSGLIEGGKR